MDTKACTITEEEVKVLISFHAHNMQEYNIDDHLDRLNYLNKRLKAFKEDGVKAEPSTEPVPEPAKTNADPAKIESW